MKPEMRLKRALAEKDLNIRLAKLETVCMVTLPYSKVWEKALREALKLRAQGARYW